MIVSQADPSAVLLEWAEELAHSASGLEHTASFPKTDEHLGEVASEFAQALDSLGACCEALAGKAESEEAADRLHGAAAALQAARDEAAGVAATQPIGRRFRRSKAVCPDVSGLHL